MLSTEVIITFFTASVLLALAPGPDNVFVLVQSAMHGRIAGLVVMLGLCTGLVFHSAAVAVGVAAIFQTSTTAFGALKFLGAGYLLYLAWQAFRVNSANLSLGPAGKSDHGRLYRRGIIMNVTNPKVSIFFLAFLPQFVDPAQGAVTVQIILLGSLFILATLVVFGAIAILAGTLSQRLMQSDRIQIGLHRMAGIVFVGLALKLAATER